MFVCNDLGNNMTEPTCCITLHTAIRSFYVFIIELQWINGLTLIILTAVCKI